MTVTSAARSTGAADARPARPKDATINTIDHPYRTAGESDGRRYGPGRGFTLGAKELIYAAVPGSIVVLDAKHDYTFVKRITFEEKPAPLPLESIAGMAASPATNMVYVSTRGHLYAINLLTEKVVWANAYEPGTCCERGQVTPIYPEAGRSLPIGKVVGLSPSYLPDSIEFTDAGTERLFVIMSDQPIDVDVARRAARASYDRAKGDIMHMPALELPGEQFQRTFIKP